jgi:hypothetical protein
MTSIASSWTHANPSRGAWINQTTFTMGDSGMNVLRTLVVGIDCRELEPLEQMPNFKKNRLSSIFVIWGHPIAIFDRSCTFVKVSTPPTMPSPIEDGKIDVLTSNSSTSESCWHARASRGSSR